MVKKANWAEGCSSSLSYNTRCLKDSPVSQFNSCFINYSFMQLTNVLLKVYYSVC